jgi:hypothetical protein
MYTKPVMVTIPNNDTIKSMSVSSQGNSISVLLGASGTFYFAGQNLNKVGGTFSGSISNRFTPIVWSNPTLPSKTIKQFYHDLGTVFVIFDDGELYAWGNNNGHQIDIANTTGYSNVTRINIGEPVAQVSSLISQSYNPYTYMTEYMITITALSTSGYVYSWGAASLGRDDMLGKSIPQKISNEQYKMLPKRVFVNNVMGTSTTNTPTPTTLATTTSTTTVPTTTLSPTTTVAATTTDTPTPTTSSPVTTASDTPTPTTGSTTTTLSPTTTNTVTSTAAVTTSAVTSTTSPTTSSTAATSTTSLTTSTTTPTTAITTTTLSPTTTGTVTSTAAVTSSAVTSTAGPTTSQSTPSTATPTTTTSVASCYDQVGGSACSGNGVCVGRDSCQCNVGVLGKQCDVVLQTTSSTFVAFDTTSNASSVINVDAANHIPGATGTANYTFASDGLQLSTTYGQSEIGKKGVCLKPSLIIANMQTFVIFNIPVTQPSGTAAEVWLIDATKQYTIHASIKQTTSGQVFGIESKSSSESTTTNLQTGVDYLLVLSIDQSGTIVTTQILTIVRRIVFISNSCSQWMLLVH